MPASPRKRPPPLSEEALALIASWFRVLAEPSRLRILRALRWKGPWFKVSAINGAGCRELCAAAYRFLAQGAKAPRARRAA